MEIFRTMLVVNNKTSIHLHWGYSIPYTVCYKVAGVNIVVTCGVISAASAHTQCAFGVI